MYGRWDSDSRRVPHNGSSAYPSKEALIQAVVASVTNRFGSFDAIPDSVSFADAIDHIVLRIFRRVADGSDIGLRFLWVVTIEQLEGDNSVQMVKVVIDAFRDRIENAVKRAQLGGEIDPNAETANAADDLVAGSSASNGCGCCIPSTISSPPPGASPTTSSSA